MGVVLDNGGCMDRIRGYSTPLKQHSENAAHIRKTPRPPINLCTCVSATQRVAKATIFNFTQCVPSEIGLLLLFFWWHNHSKYDSHKVHKSIKGFTFDVKTRSRWCSVQRVHLCDTQCHIHVQTINVTCMCTCMSTCKHVIQCINYARQWPPQDHNWYCT